MPAKDEQPELTIPLFSLPPQALAPAVEKEAPAKTVTSGKCPRCTRDRKVGLTRSGIHLWWKAHTVTTHGNVKRECAASNQKLCECAAEKVQGDGDPPLCDCQPRHGRLVQ